LVATSLINTLSFQFCGYWTLPFIQEWVVWISGAPPVSAATAPRGIVTTGIDTSLADIGAWTLSGGGPGAQKGYK
jgi:hypothetical protein